MAVCVSPDPGRVAHRLRRLIGTDSWSSVIGTLLSDAPGEHELGKLAQRGGDLAGTDAHDPARGVEICDFRVPTVGGRGPPDRPG